MKTTNKYQFKKSEYFFEENVPFDNSGFEVGVQINKKFYSGKSKYQKIDFYSSTFLGKFLVLDGVLQIAEKTEYVYHEVLCQTPMFSHTNPKRVLIIGGGPAGLSAAVELGDMGIKCIICDDKLELGGKLSLQTHNFFGSIRDCYAGSRGMDIGFLLSDMVEGEKSIDIWLNSPVLHSKSFAGSPKASHNLVSN